jgi:hypothetical protein
VTKNNRLLFEQLAQMAQEAGLGELFSFTNGQPSGWLWDKIVNNEISDSTFEFQVEQTDAFKRRYPAVAWLRSQNVGGRSSLPATMATVREYENRARDLMRSAGLPPEFYDNNVDDLQGLLMKDISLVELEQRVGEGWARVQSTDPAIRQAFSEFYGVGQGDAALAAFFLDPTQMVNKLDRMSRTAFTAGMGRNAGVDLGKVAAERITALDRSDAEMRQGIGELAGYNTLFTEGVTETQDLSVEKEGVDAAFFDNTQARQQLERRLIERNANRGGATGGALQTNRGIIGTSSA